MPPLWLGLSGLARRLMGRHYKNREPKGKGETNVFLTRDGPESPETGPSYRQGIVIQTFSEDAAIRSKILYFSLDTKLAGLTRHGAPNFLRYVP